MPFVGEEMHQNLVRGHKPNAQESVHMEAWPEADASLIDEDLLHDVDVVQRVVGLGRSAREAQQLRVRQPLGKVLVRVLVSVRHRPCKRGRSNSRRVKR